MRRGAEPPEILRVVTGTNILDELAQPRTQRRKWSEEFGQSRNRFLTELEAAALAVSKLPNAASCINANLECKSLVSFCSDRDLRRPMPVVHLALSPVARRHLRVPQASARAESTFSRLEPDLTLARLLQIRSLGP